MENKKLYFYFDILSPYSYLAWTQLPLFAGKHGCQIIPVPVLLAGLLNHFGQKGPAEIEPKRIYIFKEAIRIAHQLNVPFKIPKHYPFNPLLALRAASVLGAEAQYRFIDGLMRAIWTDGGGVSESSQIVVIADADGLNGMELLHLAQSQFAKDKLRTQTDDAIAGGIFGVPSIKIQDEVFWGVASLPHLDDFLAGKDPIDKPQILQTLHQTPLAVRKSR